MAFDGRRLRRRWKGAGIGVILSLGSPLGLLFLEAWNGSHLDSVPGMVIHNSVYIYNTLSTSIAFTIFGYLAGQMMESIELLSMTDGLTKLSNRRHMMTELENTLAISFRYEQPFCLLMLDLDHFKRVNDNYGHHIGDQTLRAVAAAMRYECRQTDFPARFGGEEFIIICPNTTEQEGVHLANRIRLHIQKLGESELGFKGVQTASLGVIGAKAGKEYHAAALLECVDQAMYSAKTNGRNRVEVGSAE